MLQAKSPSFRDCYQLYRLDARARRVTDDTLLTYKGRIEPFITWCDIQGIVSISTITSFHIRAYLVQLQERKLSSYTVNGVARALKAFFNFCVNDRLIDESPMQRVKIPKLDKKIPPALTVDDVQKLLAVCKTQRDQTLILFLIDTGVRAAELVKLNKDDIDLQSGVVTVRQGKGRKDRLVYIGAKTRKQLLRYYMERGTSSENAPVFISERGGERILTSGLRQLFQRLGEAAQVKHCTPHTFRRTFALWSLRSGMSIYHLQKLMGHADIHVLRQYLALVEADAREAHEKHGAVDNLLS